MPRFRQRAPDSPRHRTQEGCKGSLGCAGQQLIEGYKEGPLEGTFTLTPR